MERIRFYLDEHIPSAVAEGLRQRGVDVLTVQDAARSGLSDQEQLSFAHQEQRAMLTMDSDFLVIATQGLLHSGIAYANSRLNWGTH
jgi:predicted nuclease of predicted toxin-antitoxin system